MKDKNMNDKQRNANNYKHGIDNKNIQGRIRNIERERENSNRNSYRDN